MTRRSFWKSSLFAPPALASALVPRAAAALPKLKITRVALPNSGDITEFMELATLCETHYVGLAPHFSGPLAEAALVHCLAASSGPALMETLGTARPARLTCLSATTFGEAGSTRKTSRGLASSSIQVLSNGFLRSPNAPALYHCTSVRTVRSPTGEAAVPRFPRPS